MFNLKQEINQKIKKVKQITEHALVQLLFYESDILEAFRGTNYFIQNLYSDYNCRCSYSEPPVLMLC